MLLYHFKKKYLEKKYIKFSFFTLLYIVGLAYFRDYGVSLDEDAYKEIGLIEYNFLKELFLNFKLDNLSILYNNYLLSTTSKVSSIFYNITYFVRNLLEIFTKETIQLKLVSHFILFNIFFISNFFLYKIVLNRYNEVYFAFLAVLILFSSPRILAESFYNNRDLYFLSISIINIYFTQNLLKEFNYKNIFNYSISISLCINAKIFGLVFLLLALILIILENIEKISKQKLLKKIIFIIFLTALFTTLITPYLWSNPYNNFINYYFLDLNVTSEIRVTNIFLNNLYSSQNSPWYYYLTWIFFTIPLSFFIIIFIGNLKILFYFVKKIINNLDFNNFWSNKKELLDLYLILIIILTLFSITRFNNAYLDGWRHIYFLYPFMIINCFCFLNLIKKKKIIMNIIFLILSFNILYNFYWFKKNNPYSYIYFNELNSFFLKKKFDLDYWGLSNYQSYKYILKNDKRKIISIGTLSYNDLNDNLNALNEKEKYRIVLKHKDDYPDYLIDNYRISYKVFKTINKSQYLKDYNKVEEVIIDNNIVNTIYKKK